MIYDYYKEIRKKKHKGAIIAVIIAFLIAALVAALSGIYMKIIQLDEMGGFSKIYLKDLTYKCIFFGISFVVIFCAIAITTIFIKKNVNKYLSTKGYEPKKLPIFSIAAVIALFGAMVSNNVFYSKALSFFNHQLFGKTDPIFGKDIGYYVFQRPFLISIYEFILAVAFLIIIYTAIYYFITLLSSHALLNEDDEISKAFSLKDLRVKIMIRHNLINIAIFILIKALSYKFQMEGLLYSNFVGVTGAGFIDANIWMNYFKVIPFVIVAIAVVSFIFIVMGYLKKAAFVIAAFPVIWIAVSIVAAFVQYFYVNPYEFNREEKYLKYNMEKTREAYKIDTIQTHEFPAMQDLTKQIIDRNANTKDNIRIIDYTSTLKSNIQLQSNTNFYTFTNGDIINYTINNKEMPVFITARELDTNRLPDKTYLNKTFKYTHGYGIVMNPINKVTSGGQVDFILSGLRLNSIDKNLKLTEPRIYYGEMTNNYCIVNASGINEIDYDGNTDTRYQGKGGIKLNLINKLLFALKYKDLNMLISGYVNSDSKILLNREIVPRVQMALPFLKIDNDPCIVLTSEGRLKWVVDAYTTNGYYPYAQYYGDINYIRNSVKVVVDSYDGKLDCYIMDKNDPIINAYNKMYPGIFLDQPLPDDIKAHMRYPEELFKIQTDILRRYHLNPKNVSEFYTKQDLWNIAKYHADRVTNISDQTSKYDISDTTSNQLTDIQPYYSMIKLPGNIGEKEELILLRPFTPSGVSKNNMVSWLSVRNSAENYGEMVLFTFPKNTNIFGPNQVDIKINQIDQISKDISLWNQGGSNAYKGNLLVIPIENSVLYVQPVYIRAQGESSIPEVREIVVGYQKGDEFKYGIGISLDAALNDLFKDEITTPIKPTTTEATPQVAQTVNEQDKQIINEIMKKYDDLKKQIDEMGDLIERLK